MVSNGNKAPHGSMVTSRKPAKPLTAGADVYPALTLEIMDLVGNKWTLLLVYRLASGPLRFSELKREAAPISQKMLTQKLRELERFGLVDRFVWPTTPPKVEYALTSLGRSFLDAASVICEWTRDNVADLGNAREAFDALRHDLT